MKNFDLKNFLSENKFTIRNEVSPKPKMISESSMAKSYVKSAASNSYVNSVTFDDVLLPLAQELDTYSSRGMGDLEYSKETLSAFKKLVDLMKKDHKEADDND